MDNSYQSSYSSAGSPSPFFPRARDSSPGGTGRSGGLELKDPDEYQSDAGSHSDESEAHDPGAFLFESHGTEESRDLGSASHPLGVSSILPAQIPRIVTHDYEEDDLPRGGAPWGGQGVSRDGGHDSYVDQDEEDHDAPPTQSLLMEHDRTNSPLGSIGMNGSQRQKRQKRPGDRIGFLRFLAGTGTNRPTMMNESMPGIRRNSAYSSLPHSRYDDRPSVDMLDSDDRTYSFLPRDRAVRLWNHATSSSANLDRFLQRCYSYYVGKGMYCILLERISSLLILAFVMWFSVFLLGCVDYSQISGGKSLSDVIVPHCVGKIHGIPMLFILLFWVWWCSQAVQLGLDVPRLKELHGFYTFLLEIPDVDVQSVSWTLVVSRLAKLPMPRDESSIAPPETNHVTPATQPPVPSKLTALSIASRIMRRENYWIPLLVRRDLIDLSMPLFGDVLTKSMEWNVYVAVFGWLFDRDGTIRRRVREGGLPALRELVAGLRRRFLLLGVVNLICSPLILGFVLLYFFFKHAERFQKSPTLLNMRGYSRIAKWRFREFNELPHYFHQRLNRSYPKAVAYLDGFPRAKTAIIARTVTFISGAFAAVLTLAAWLDEGFLLSFEITPGRSGLFYIGLFGAILAVGRGLTPDPYASFDPRGMMQAIAKETHYLPTEWSDKLHADEVRREFSRLFGVKVVLFLQELVGIFWTPYILLTRLPEHADRIVGFFIENTRYDAEVGWVCRYALFDAGEDDDAWDEQGDDDEVHAKMGQSIVGFRIKNPGWVPGVVASGFLEQLGGGGAGRVPMQESVELADALGSAMGPTNWMRGSSNSIISEEGDKRRGRLAPGFEDRQTRYSDARGPRYSQTMVFEENGEASRTMDGNRGVVNMFKELYEVGRQGIV